MIPWPQIITGVVGLGGIAGTIVSARLAANTATKNLELSIAAENERAREASRRQVYTACLTALHEFYTMGDRIHSMHQDNPEKAEAAQKLNDIMDAAYRAVSEVRLMAPPKVWNAVLQAANAISNYADVGARGEDSAAVNELLALATTAMREDLGERPVAGSG
jgi:uncharacterized alpha-E superfamily protein